MAWGKLLKRVVEIDLERCPNCGGELNMIVAITEAQVIERIVTQLALAARTPLGCPDD